MAAPLITDGECIGVLKVLDRGSRDRGELGDVDLLGLPATELSAAVELLLRLRWTSGHPSAAPPRRAVLLRRVAQRLPGAPEPAAAAAVDQLLAGHASTVT